MYESMAEELRIYGIVKTGEQCCSKVKKLRQGFKKVKDKNRGTGNDRKKMKFYDELNELLGNKPSVSPPVVVDSLDSSSSTEKLPSEDEAGRDEEKGDDLSDSNEKDVKAHSEEKVSSSIRGKKKRRNKGEIIEEVVTKAMKTVTDGLKESEKMFLEMEERQMNFEERMRRQDQEFQMQMMKMMMSCLPSSSQNPYPPYPPYYDQDL